MTKGALIELIQERIKGGALNSDVWKKAHPLVIEKYIGMAFNTIFYTIFKNEPEGLNLYAKLYKDNEVKQDSDYYIDLPCSIVQMPDNSSSIKKVSVSGNSLSDTGEAVFLPASLLANPVLARLGTIGRSGVITFRVEGYRIYFTDFDPSIKKVDVYAITPFEDFNLDDEIAIPAGQDLNFVDMILKFFMGIPEDRATNNAN